MKPHSFPLFFVIVPLQKRLGCSRLRFSPLAALVTAAALLLALPAGATTYYSKGSLPPGTLANWSTTTDGTGASPANFTTAADLFIIQAGHTMSGSTWVLTGALQINATGVLTLSTSPGITLGSLNNSGTVNLNGGSNVRTLILNGNLVNVNNGLITVVSTGQNVTIQFSGNATWTGSGDISAGRVQLVVDTSKTLDISGLTTGLKFRNTGTMVSTINGTLITGTQIINGNGDTSHTLGFSATATLVTANAGGVNGTFTWAGPLTFDPAASFNFNGSVAQVTGTQLPATIGSLMVNNASGVTLSQATTVNGALGLTAGALTTTSTALLTIGSAGSVTGSGQVNGPLARAFSATGSKSFRVGKGGNIRPVTLNYTALTGTSTVTVEQFEGVMGGTLPANTAQFTSRYWSVAQSGGSGITFDLTLDGTGFSPVGTARILQEGTPDASYSTTFASPAYTATGITSTGNFTLGDLTAGLDQLAFTTSAHTLAAGVTSGTITVQLQDSGSTPKTAVSDLTVNLSTTSGAGAFRDTGDTTTISTVTILAGTDSASFKYRDTAPGTPILTATATGIAAANQQQTVTAGAAAQLMFTTQPANTYVNYTLAPVVVQIRDAYGNNVSQSGTPITLTLNNGGGAVLSGTNPQNTDGTGKATFNDLAINGAGAGMSFAANDGSLPTAMSATFDITYRQIVKAKNTIAMDQPSGWQGGVVPGQYDIAVINDSGVSASSANARVDFGASASWLGLIVSNWSANTGYTVSNTVNGTLTLGASGIAGTDINHSLTMSNHFALAAAQTWSWGDANSTGGTLNLNGDINNNGHALTLSGKQAVFARGVISGGGGLVRTGDGPLTLTGANLYNGPTTISSGTLRVDGSLAAGSTVTVTGGTLQGAGTVNGTVDVQAGGTLAPGSGAIGTLTINGPAANSGTIVAEITSGPSADKVVFGSTVQLGGTLTVTNLGTLVNGTTYDLFDFNGGPPTGAAFSTVNLPGGASHWDTTDLLVGGTITFANNAPVAPNFGLGVAVGGTQSVAVIDKYARDADVGDVLTVTSVSVPANGTASIVGGTSIVYTSTINAASDSFTYTVSDGFTTSTGTVTVSTYSPVGFNRLSGPVDNGNGTFTLNYFGIPDFNYALEESPNLIPPYTWFPVVTNAASGTGALSYTVTLSYPSGSFRTRYVP